jgi:hypothetical protein
MLSDLTNGKTAVSAEMALRLENAFGVSMDLLLRMQAGYDAAQVRRRTADIDVRATSPTLAQRPTDALGRRPLLAPELLENNGSSTENSTVRKTPSSAAPKPPATSS